MAWMLCEQVTKAIVALVIFFLKKLWEEAVSKKCLIPACMRTEAPVGRGLCLVCYSQAKKKIDAGETTWQKLAELGLAKPEANPFDDAYTRAMEDH